MVVMIPLSPGSGLPGLDLIYHGADSGQMSLSHMDSPRIQTSSEASHGLQGIFSGLEPHLHLMALEMKALPSILIDHRILRKKCPVVRPHESHSRPALRLLNQESTSG